MIIGGAPIADHDAVRERIGKPCFVIYCDSGLKHREKLKLEADLVVGDFDSHKKPESDTETIVLPCEKDDTDTVYAVKEALKRGYSVFTLIGVIGARLDHSLGNVSILLYLDSLQKKGRIIDDYSEMEIVSSTPVSVGDEYPFFSLLSISGPAENVTIKNAKYPLSAAAITPDYQYGISNEVLPGKTAEISVGKGRLLLIKVRRG